MGSGKNGPRSRQDCLHHGLISRNRTCNVCVAHDFSYLIKLFCITRAIEFAKHGASGLVLHYLGDAVTETEIQSLKREIETDSVKVVIVPGDIANPETSTKVRQPEQAKLVQY